MEGGLQAVNDDTAVPSPAESERLARALEGSRLGLWDWNMQTGETILSERWAEIIGYTLAELEPVSIETWLAHAHPDDLEISRGYIEAHSRGETDFYDAVVRMRHRDGHWVWVHDRGRIVERDAAGRPLRMVGTHEDVTDRVEAERSSIERAQRRDA
ncbi:MAG TPA: sensor domain-containing diguanylate cyclase, partial [Actinobacteria bacterium]|nr:sensor domain-containing diguanylate cyclase [Actinomycetota bacterium]